MQIIREKMPHLWRPRHKWKLTSQHTWLLLGLGPICRFPAGPTPGVNVLLKDTSEQSIKANRIQENFVFILFNTINLKRVLLTTAEIKNFVDVLVARKTAFL